MEAEQKIKIYFDSNKDRGVSDSTIWDTMKAVLRGELITLSSANKKEKKNTEKYCWKMLKIWQISMN